MGLEVGKWPTARVQNVNVSFTNAVEPSRGSK